MDWKLEVVPIPITDIDRAKRFYEEQLGFNVGCSLHLNSGLQKTAPGSLEGLQIVVDDIEAAHAHLVERGVDVTPVRNFTDGEWRDGKGGDWNSFVFFSDPDGNEWVLQERPASQ